MNEIFETTEPTVEDKKYDAFIKGIIKNTSRNFNKKYLKKLYKTTIRPSCARGTA
ncbi:MAG: hypothetical protein ACLRQ0_09070 [Monoglobales bacterium]